MEPNKEAPAPYVDVTQNPQPPAAQEGAHADSKLADSSRADAGTPPPQYSLDEQMDIGFRSLAVGDPNETISVPMIHSTDNKSLKDMILHRPGKVSQTVIVRKMPRRHYLAHYAKDENGKYVGTEKPAVDAGLVFVPSMSTPEDIKEQVRKVAFGKMHFVDGRFTAASAMGGTGF